MISPTVEQRSVESLKERISQTIFDTFDHS